MQAVAGKFVSCDVVPDLAGLHRVGQQVSDHVADLSLRCGDVLASMQELRDFGAVVLVLMVLDPPLVDEGVGLEHGFEPLPSVAVLVSDLGEMLQVAGDLTVVPVQDRVTLRGEPGNLRQQRGEPSLIEGLLSRGDRRVGAVIRSVWEKGGG